MDVLSLLEPTHPLCVIMTGGRVDHPDRFLELFQKADYVIAADSGLSHLEVLNLCPDLIVGDFDSYSNLHHLSGRYEAVETVTFPAEKDYTDTELAMIEAVRRGYQQIVFVGATGTRLDHTFANVLLLKRLDELGATGYVVDDHNEIFLMKGQGLYSVDPVHKGFFSIVPLSEHIIVSLEGFKYPLHEQKVPFASTMTISNEAVSSRAAVTLHEGLALGLLTRD